MPSPCTASARAFSVKAFRDVSETNLARTTWPETHWPRRIKRPRDNATAVVLYSDISLTPHRRNTKLRPLRHSGNKITSLTTHRRNRDFTQRRRRQQREREKRNRLRQAKQRLCTCITFFCTFLCCRYTTTTWNCLVSRFVENGNKRQQLSLCYILNFDAVL